MKIDNIIMKKLCLHKFCVLAMKKYCNHIIIIINKPIIVTYLSQKTVIYRKLCKEIHANFKLILKAKANLWHRNPKIMTVNINIQFGKKKNNVNE